jgi:hypothetical protein
MQELKPPFVVSLSNHALCGESKRLLCIALPRAWFDKLTTNGILDRFTTNEIFDRLATRGISN